MTSYLIGLNKNKGVNAVKNESAIDTIPLGQSEGSNICSTSFELANNIISSLRNALGEEHSYNVNVKIINRIIGSTFWTASKSQFNLLNDQSYLLSFSASDGKFVFWKHDDITDKAQLESLARIQASKNNLTKSETKKFITYVCELANAMVLDHIKYFNQRDKVKIDVDMFADKSYVLLHPDHVFVHFEHVDYVAPLESYKQEIIDDYLDHFKEFDDLLASIIASRFATDRKKSFLWLRCPSDWGKGLLIQLLANLDVLTPTSTSEIEKIFSGGAVGMSMDEFKRSLVLSVDEFKNVKSEIKQLCSEIKLSPKMQLNVTVPVYFKLFTSAEEVASLANENGIEDQFANRFACIEGEGSIEKRDVWRKFGKAEYAQNLQTYIALKFNKLIAEYRSLGKLGSSKKADQAVDEFHHKYRIDKRYIRFSSSLESVAAEISDWLVNDSDTNHYINARFSDYVFEYKNHFYVKSISKVIDIAINELYEKSQVGAINKKKEELIKLLSTDQIIKTRSFSGKKIKCIQLKLHRSYSIT